MTGQQRASLGDALSTRGNSLNSIRLFLAMVVLYSHSYPVTGRGEDPSYGGTKYGTLAVGAFFAISGYLIAMSRERKSTLYGFVWARAARILPGLWVCVLLTTFVFAPLLSHVYGGWTWHDATTYLVPAFFLLASDTAFHNLLAQAPVHAMNASLWTVSFEVLCYGLLTVASMLTALWSRRWVSVVVLAAAVATASVALHDRPETGMVFALAITLPYFLAGVVLYRFRNEVPVDGRLAAAAAFVIVAASLLGEATSITQLPMAYLLMWLGLTLPDWFGRPCRVNDYSYGTYVYGFPMQQLLVAYSVDDHVPFVVFMALSMVTSLACGAASWHLVERRALHTKPPGLARLLARRQAATAPLAPDAGPLVVSGGRGEDELHRAL